MTTIYNKCNRCGKWTIEREMDYFTEIGLVCMDCKDELLNENYQKSTKSVNEDTNPFAKKSAHEEMKDLLDKDYALDKQEVKR